MQANVRLFCSVDKIMKHLSEALGIEVDYKQSESSKENNENNENNNNNENSKSVPYNPKVEIPKGIPQLLHAKESIHRIVSFFFFFFPLSFLFPKHRLIEQFFIHFVLEIE